MHSVGTQYDETHLLASVATGFTNLSSSDSQIREHTEPQVVRISLNRDEGEMLTTPSSQENNRINLGQRDEELLFRPLRREIHNRARRNGLTPEDEVTTQGVSSLLSKSELESTSDSVSSSKATLTKRNHNPLETSSTS